MLSTEIDMNLHCRVLMKKEISNMLGMEGWDIFTSFKRNQPDTSSHLEKVKEKCNPARPLATDT